MRLISQHQKTSNMIFTLPAPSSTMEQSRYKYEFVQQIKRTNSSLIEIDILEQELTRFCASYSENSLKEVWENENDAYWESYLTNK